MCKTRHRIRQTSLKSADSDGAYLLGLGTLAAFADFILHTLTNRLTDRNWAGGSSEQGPQAHAGRAGHRNAPPPCSRTLGVI